MLEQKQIGIYRVIKSLGGGGMGVVYLVEDMEAGGQYALKVLSPSLTLTEREIRRFRREFMTMSRLRHPNIVEVYESGMDDDSLYFVMEYVKGAHLRQRFLDRNYTEESPQDPDWLSYINHPERTEAVLKTMLQICDALAWIHSYNIVHRDLKPENLLIKRDGRVKLLDFGIAKRLGGGDLTQSRSILGTFSYLSPEQALCEDVDGRSDLYALGVILYELLTGRPPFMSAEPIGRIFMHMNKPAPPLNNWNPQLDPRLEEIVLRLLEKDPMNRFQRAEDLRAALEECIPGQRHASGWMVASASGERVIAEPAFVGRQHERQLFLEQLENTRNGVGTLFLLSGNTGMGKTRLAREFLASARAQQVECCSVRCLSDSPPYAAYQELLEQLRTSLMLRDTSLPQRLWGREGDFWFRMTEAPLIGQVKEREKALAAQDPNRLDMSMTISSSEDTLTPTNSSGPEEEKAQLFDAVRFMISRILETEPLVFFLDDLMSADETSLELTEYLVRSLTHLTSPYRLMLLGTFRNEDVGPEHPLNHLMVRLTPQQLYQIHDLKPLPSAQVAEMTNSMVGIPPAPQTLEQLMLQSQGIPFFVKELVKAWHEEGLLFDEEMQLYLAQKGASSEEEGGVRGHLPSAIRNRLSRRLERLSAQARGLSEWIAVLDQDVSFEILSEVTGLPEEQLLQLLDELIQQKILSEDWTSGSERYRFDHPGIQETVYLQLSEDARRSYHIGVAYALRRLSATEGAFELLGHHFAAGGDELNAAWFLLLAAERQLRAFAHRSTWELLERCQQIYHRHSTAPLFEPATAWWWRYHLAYLELMEAVAQYRQGLELVEYALQTMPTGGDTTPLLRWKATFLREIGNYREALACVKVALAEPTENEDLRLYLLQESGRIYRAQGRYSAALEAYREALAWAVSRKLIWEQGRLSGMIGQVLHQRGEFPEAEAYYLQSLEIATQGGDRRGEIEAMCKLGTLELDSGNVAASLKRFEKATAAARALGDRRMECTAMALSGQLQGDRRLYSEAQETLENALVISQELGDQRMEGELLSWLGVQCYNRDRLEAARLYLEEGIQRSQFVGDRLLELWIRCHLSVVSLREGNLEAEEVLEEMHRILRLSEQMEAMEVVLLCKLISAHIFRLLDMRRDAYDALVAARYLADQIGNRRLLAKIEREHYLLSRAQAA
ncbi:MAG: protein kinase [Myxococcales bacterium]|nr:protein kinase [Myxococcales bacterium]